MARIPGIFGRPVLNPFTITTVYVVVGVVWIVFSDRILGIVGSDMSVAHVTRIQTLKGILYIALSAGLIYLLIGISAQQVMSSRNELQEVKTRYLQLFEKTGAIIFIVDGRTSSIVEVNAAAELFYGMSRRELVGRKVREMEVADLPAGDDDLVLDPADQRFSYARHRLASGEERDVAINATSIVAAGRQVEFLLIHDITERRLLECQLRQAQKMEAVGRLTGGIAHDLNNVLTVVLADADLIAAELGEIEGDVKEDLDDLRSAARRGAGMIRKLVSFSRSANLRMATLDLGSAVEEQVPAMRRLLPENVQLIARINPTGLVRVDQAALEQIVMNLATNARDALRQGGSFIVETGCGWLGPLPRHPWAREGHYAFLKVIDTGVGMDQRTQASMFEPFFTTKPPTDGGGLGMAMVYGLVKQHEGFVLVDSKPGEGTTVSIYLPPAPKLDQAEETGANRPAETGAGGETILLVEDEDALRRAGQRILERLGYVVIIANNGQRGLEILREKGESIDLVISDMVMPKIGGRAFYEAARVQHKDVRFLFTSGYAPSTSSESTPVPDVPFIQKPWTFDELSRKVREVLSSKPA